ncbi:Uncharacterized protein PRO82_000645 [Candidatus Protochlamydia amoebophila]|uniref:YidH family protein n=1 Tax=Candidatus Protochlamydia amoebophila TaxID=362787 RepID=UPI001BC8F34F|nr:DUF202 domain-containing protein [Candidatus Protochlamydia amoebophila]MBS4163344.1 Uncharacterized protein [Candidatus Protochlamydia amoebophila]
MTDSQPSVDERILLAQERTRLAAERTFLAWLRTGLTGIGIGIAIARFVFFQIPSHQKITHLMGQFLILWGICIFLFALNSYRKSLKKIGFSKSYFRPPFILRFRFNYSSFDSFFFDSLLYFYG